MHTHLRTVALVVSGSLMLAASCGGESASGLFGAAGQGGGADASAGGGAGQGGAGFAGNPAGAGGNPAGAAGNPAGAGGSPAGAGGGGAAGDSGTAGNGAIPADCTDAAAHPSHFGCEFWPTITANLVWSVFDFAVLAVNPGPAPVDVHVTGPNSVNLAETIPALSSKVLYLPWVAALKGADTDSCGTASNLAGSVRATGGAYHLTSNAPIAAWQFNPIEYEGTGGPAGKSWASCPGSQSCSSTGTSIGCFSFSSDASLLLPTSALTGVYRVGGPTGWSYNGTGITSSYLVVTATSANTHVSVQLKGRTLAGGGLAALSAGQTATLTMEAGDVFELVGGDADADDLSGSLVTADKPVQVISGTPCKNMPSDQSACDHLEEVLPPAQALGKSYVVARTAAPNGQPAASQVVRIVGNVDQTTLTFDPALTAPGVSNGKATVQAGGVLDLGLVASDFTVSGDHEFLVMTFLPGSAILDPGGLPPDQNGDPSESVPVAVEQYRSAYALAVPETYSLVYLDVTAPLAASVALDGQPIPAGTFQPVGSGGWRVARVKLLAAGMHAVTSDAPVGVQAYGFGSYTSFLMPAGAGVSVLSAAPQH